MILSVSPPLARVVVVGGCEQVWAARNNLFPAEPFQPACLLLNYSSYSEALRVGLSESLPDNGIARSRGLKMRLDREKIGKKSWMERGTFVPRLSIRFHFFRFKQPSNRVEMERTPIAIALG